LGGIADIFDPLQVGFYFRRRVDTFICQHIRIDEFLGGGVGCGIANSSAICAKDSRPSLCMAVFTFSVQKSSSLYLKITEKH